MPIRDRYWPVDGMTLADINRKNRERWSARDEPSKEEKEQKAKKGLYWSRGLQKWVTVPE